MKNKGNLWVKVLIIVIITNLITGFSVFTVFDRGMLLSDDEKDMYIIATHVSKGSEAALKLVKKYYGNNSIKAQANIKMINQLSEK